MDRKEYPWMCNTKNQGTANNLVHKLGKKRTIRDSPLKNGSSRNSTVFQAKIGAAQCSGMNPSAMPCNGFITLRHGGTSVCDPTSPNPAPNSTAEPACPHLLAIIRPADLAPLARYASYRLRRAGHFSCEGIDLLHDAFHGILVGLQSSDAGRHPAIGRRRSNSRQTASHT